MGFLDRIENFIQSTIEGGTGAVFGNDLTLVDIENQLTRAMRENTRASHGGRIAPNSYTVWLHPATLEKTLAGVQSYNRRCEMLLNKVATDQGYTLLQPRIMVAFEADENLGRRKIRVQAAHDDVPAAGAPYRAANRAGDTQMIAATPTTNTRSSSWSVTVVRGRDVGKRFSLHEGETRLGRADSNDIAVNDDANTVSREHATLYLYGDTLELRDIGSKNGTRVNGNWVPKLLPTVMHDGTEVSLGACVLRIRRENTRGGR